MCEKEVSRKAIMDISIEKAADITLGSLFQQIINDMKVSLTFFDYFTTFARGIEFHSVLSKSNVNFANKFFCH